MVAKYLSADGTDKIHCLCFLITGVTEDQAKNLQLQESEIDRVEFWKLDEIKGKLDSGEVQVTPDSMFAWSSMLDAGHFDQV